MWSRRKTKAVVGGVIVASVLAVAVPANGLAPPPPLIPAVATHGDDTVIAWGTRSSQIMVATRGADGTFTNPAPVPGAGASPGSLRLAIAPSGDELLLWQSGPAIRSAFRAAGDSAWLVENPAGKDRLYTSDAALAVDSSGRAFAAWIASSDASPTPVLQVSIRPPGRSWSDPVTVASGPSSVSLATDRVGDVALAYTTDDPASSATVWATTLRAGEATWDMPTPLSPARQPIARTPVVAGGGARTFTVSWQLIGTSGALAVARIRLPGSWQAMPNPTPEVTIASALTGTWSSAIDDLGNALVVTQYANSKISLANAAVRLAVTDDQWAPSATLDAPDGTLETDSPAGVTLGADGSATVAFMRQAPHATTLHVASTDGPTGAWLGADSAAGTLPCFPGRCGNDWLVAPVVARAGTATVVVAQSDDDGVVIAFTRASPDAPWQGPVTLQGFGTTRVYLASAHVRKGYIRIFTTCALPPCRGTAVVRATGGSQRTLGRASFADAGTYPASAPLQLARWARASLKHGKHLRVLVTFDALEGNGTTDTAERTVLLHT